jgi:hypothetical protein
LHPNGSLSVEAESMPISNEPGSFNSEPGESFVADLRRKEFMDCRRHGSRMNLRRRVARQIIEALYSVPTESALQARQRSTDRIGLATEAALHNNITNL